MMNLASMFRLDNMDLTTLFSIKSLDEEITGDKKLYSPATKPPAKSKVLQPDITDFVKVAPPIEHSPTTTSTVPTSEKTVLKPSILSPEIPEDFDKTNKEILEEQIKQTKILEEGLTKPAPTETVSFIENQREEREANNFVRLETSLKDHQTITTDKLSEDVTKKFEDVGKDIIKAISMGGGAGAGGGLLEDVADVVGGADTGKPGFLKRTAGKLKRGAKGVGRTVAKPVTGAASFVSKPLIAAGGTAAKIGTTGVGTLAGGGAAGATTVAGGVLLAGAGGYAVGTGINKLATKVAGREDWLLGWIGDIQEEKAKDKSRKDNLKKWRSKLSPSVIEMMGGEENFEAEKFIGLRFKGLIKSHEGKWYTKGEYDLLQVDGVNKTTEAAERSTKPFPVNLLDLEDTISDKDKKAFEKLMDDRKKLLSDYSANLLAGFVKEGSELQLKNLLESYEELESEAKDSSGKTKTVLLERMKTDAEVIKDITGGMSVEELKSSYKSNVAVILKDRMEELNVNRTNFKESTQLPEMSTAPEVLNLAEKQMDSVKQMKAASIDSINTEIKSTKKVMAATPNEAEKERLTEKIQQLQSKKTDIEAMSDKQYEDWLKNTIKETRQTIAEIKRSKQAEIFRSSYNVNMEVSNLVKGTTTTPNVVKAPVLPTPTTAPAPEIVASAANETKAKQLAVKETIRTEGRANQEVKVIHVPVPTATPSPTPMQRQLMVDDPKVDLLRIAL